MSLPKLSRSMPKFTHGIVMAAALMPIAANAQAAATDSAVVDDFEAATNQNKFLAYTFYYGDDKDGGTTEIKSATKSGTELLFDATKSVGEGYGGSKNSLKLDFVYGANKPSCGTACTYGQMAGVGTGFVPDGQVINLTGATSVTFWAKASAAMAMRVEIATKPVTNFGYHLYQAALTTSWQQYTVPLVEGPDFQQPAWAAQAAPVPFDPTQVEKIQFAISADDNPALTQGQVFIDNIVVRGYKWVPPSACIPCVGKVGTGALLSNLDVAPKTQNKAGGYWYAYNDAEGRTVATQSEYSEIFEGVTPNTVEPTKPTFAVSTGKGDAGTDGALISFKLGPTYLQGTETIRPFVGIGTKVSDALGTQFSNMTGSTGISFSYWTSAASTFDYIRLEAKANQANPAFAANAGIVHSVLLPSTAGVWKTVVVLWTDMKLPDWDEVKLIPLAQQALNVAAMDKFQWAVQGEPGVEGSLAVDNVKIEGLTAINPIASIRGGIGARGQGFSLTQGLRNLQVAVNLGELAQQGEIRLLNLKGEVVRKTQVAGTGMKTAELSTLNLNSGVYAVQVKVGERAMTAPVTVLP